MGLGNTIYKLFSQTKICCFSLDKCNPFVRDWRGLFQLLNCFRLVSGTNYMASCCFQGPSCVLSLQWTLIVVIWRWVVARGNLPVLQLSNGGCGAGGHAPLPGARVGKQAEDLAGITLWMPVGGARVNSIWSKILSSLQGLLSDTEKERRLGGILEHPEFRYSICSFKGWVFFP